MRTSVAVQLCTPLGCRGVVLSQVFGSIGGSFVSMAREARRLTDKHAMGSLHLDGPAVALLVAMSTGPAEEFEKADDVHRGIPISL